MAVGAGCVVSNVTHLLTLLMTLQSAALNNSGGDPAFDPKSYIDLSLRKDVSLGQAQSAYAELRSITNDTLHNYIAQHFDEAGSELELHPAADFAAAPDEFLPDVKNAQVLAWAHDVHAIWRNLTRHETPEVAADNERFTMVPLANAFVIPGSRFREIYYWDSYWVIRGLLVSRMHETARGIVDNLLGMVETYGFVPNGARKYYLNRSQPPLLSQMVRAVYEATGDARLLERAVPILIREHGFWTSAPHSVGVVDAHGTVHSLSRYYANWNTPRPESYVYDRAVAESVAGASEEETAQLYNDIATGAETGWDFSSRWMADRFNLSTLRTSRIVPADLNALLFQLERNVAHFARLLADDGTAAEFAQHAERRKAAIEAVLWNDEAKQWNDFWLPANASCSGPTTTVAFDRRALNTDAMASNFVPLWTGLVAVSQEDADDRTDAVDAIVAALERSGLLQPAGIATTATNTGQQWDFPNGWAPLQHMIIEGLALSNTAKARATAEELAVRWVRTNHAAFVSTGAMHEKYDVRRCGAAGGGGEYTPQTGFGWSNGVVLAFLDQFGWPEHRDLACTPNA
ncbi:alpha,alpha-trehalase [Marchantia polymorpha subsp. ruderalis]|uniref:Trehalase n=2 Tax=Marchantia polymorpha TaxID=3197 RepID=A0AAF6ANU1_MARPO|nr:hypothetical protein MARPO_0014s0133 [Marchantia polymorpha]BBM98111.1 hypothetical protein Mp_1g10930 [Marchantia polymorpha subsp. ruderalis]|eukprot:PTQ45613.1 hypothetical protein MARPO_0014s0133 [Marchantia polymorpha]